MTHEYTPCMISAHHARPHCSQCGAPQLHRSHGVTACECRDPFHDSNPEIPRMGCGKVVADGDMGWNASPLLCTPCLFSCDDFNGVPT